MIIIETESVLWNVQNPRLRITEIGMIHSTRGAVRSAVFSFLFLSRCNALLFLEFEEDLCFFGLRTRDCS